MKRFLVLLAVMCSVGAGAFATASSAVAQEADYDLQVFVSTCEATSCDDVEPELLAGAEVLVMSETGEEYGTCTTVTDVTPGGCAVMVPAGSTVEVAVLTASIPDGYVVLDSPQSYQVPEEKTSVGDVWFSLTLQEDTVPDDQDTDEEVADDATGADTPTELPSTGAGIAQGSPLAGSLAVIATLLVATAAVMTRRRAA